jgi:hypothetical protein
LNVGGVIVPIEPALKYIEVDTPAGSAFGIPSK